MSGMQRRRERVCGGQEAAVAVVCMAVELDGGEFIREWGCSILHHQPPPPAPVPRAPTTKLVGEGGLDQYLV